MDPCLVAARGARGLPVRPVRRRRAPHDGGPAGRGDAGPASCGGAAIDPTQVFTGEFGTEQQGSFVLLPFDVPAGTTAVRVKYCWDPPIGPFTRHTLDLGLYQARDYPGELYGADEFRGWGGSSHPDVIVSERGVQERGGVRREPAHERAGQDDARLHPGPDPAGRVGGRAGARGDRPAVARRPGRQGRLARRDPALQRPGVRGRALPAGSLRHARRRSAAAPGTRATSTCTPSTRRSATRP